MDQTKEGEVVFSRRLSAQWQLAKVHSSLFRNPRARRDCHRRFRPDSSRGRERPPPASSLAEITLERPAQNRPPDTSHPAPGRCRGNRFGCVSVYCRLTTVYCYSAPKAQDSILTDDIVPLEANSYRMHQDALSSQ